MLETLPSSVAQSKQLKHLNKRLFDLLVAASYRTHGMKKGVEKRGETKGGMIRHPKSVQHSQRVYLMADRLRL